MHFLRASACSTPHEGADIHSRHRLDVGRQSVAEGREWAQHSQVLELCAEDSLCDVYAVELEVRPPGAPTIYLRVPASSV